MKANNGTGNNINRDDWETPSEIFDQLKKQYNFTFDCCATKTNTKCKTWSEDFLLEKNKKNICWINPPFSKAKQMFEHFFNIVNKGVGIYRIDNIETQCWYLILQKSDWIHIFNKRINYEGHFGKGARFGSALFGVGVAKPINIDGTTIKKI